MPAWMVAACAIQVLLFLACAAAIVVLRLLRRGSARFAAAPAVVALLLLPIAFACAATAQALSNVLEGLALTGSGGIAAISAGLAEALISLLIGFTSSSILVFFGGIALAAGTSGVKPGRDGSAPGAGGPLVSFVVMGLTGGLVVFLWRLVDQASRLKIDQGMTRVMPLVLAGAALLGVLLATVAVVGAVKAARGRTPIPVALASLALLFTMVASLPPWNVWYSKDTLRPSRFAALPAILHGGLMSNLVYTHNKNLQALQTVDATAVRQLLHAVPVRTQPSDERAIRPDVVVVLSESLFEGPAIAAARLRLDE